MQCEIQWPIGQSLVWKSSYYVACRNHTPKCRRLIMILQNDAGGPESMTQPQKPIQTLKKYMWETPGQQLT